MKSAIFSTAVIKHSILITKPIAKIRNSQSDIVISNKNPKTNEKTQKPNRAMMQKSEVMSLKATEKAYCMLFILPDINFAIKLFQTCQCFFVIRFFCDFAYLFGIKNCSVFVNYDNSS